MHLSLPIICLTLFIPVGTTLSAQSVTIGGNARLTGGFVRIEGLIGGALAVSGGSIFLDTRIDGDVWLAARDVKFGPDSAIAGTFHVTLPDEINIPETVAAPDRIVFQRLDVDDMPMHAPDWAPDWTNGWMRDMGRGDSAPRPFDLSGGTVLTVAFLLAIGTATLALGPERTGVLRNQASRHP